MGLSVCPFIRIRIQGLEWKIAINKGGSEKGAQSVAGEERDRILGLVVGGFVLVSARNREDGGGRRKKEIKG